MQIERHLDIRAPAQDVWAATVDIESWPSLTPTVTSVERLDDGPLRVGRTARIVQPGLRPLVWTVTAFEPPRLFSWRTKLLWMPMVATHRIEETPTGSRNTLTIDISGFGSRLLGRLAGRRLGQTLATENEGFRRRAEAAGEVPAP